MYGPLVHSRHCPACLRNKAHAGNCSAIAIGRTVAHVAVVTRSTRSFSVNALLSTDEDVCQAGRVLICWSRGQGIWVRLTSVSGVSPCLVQRSRIERKGLHLDFPDTQIMILSTLRVPWATSTSRRMWTWRRIHPFVPLHQRGRAGPRPDRCSHPIPTEPRLIEVTPISSTILQFRTRQHRGHVRHRAVAVCPFTCVTNAEGSLM